MPTSRDLWVKQNRLSLRRAVLLRCAVAAALGVAILPSSRPAIAANSLLTISASRAASVDVTFTKATKLNAEQLRADLKGSYAAIYIARLGSPDFRDLLVVVNPVLLGPGQPPAILGSDDDPLPAGRYRVSLLTDGSATLRVPLTAGSSMTLRPTRRLSPQRRLVTAPTTGVPYAAVASQAVFAGPSPLLAVIGTAQFADRPVDLHDLAVCLQASSGATPCSNGDPAFGLGTRALNAKAGIERAAIYVTSEDDLASGKGYAGAVEYRGLTQPVAVRLFLLAASGVY